MKTVSIPKMRTLTSAMFISFMAFDWRVRYLPVISGSQVKMDTASEVEALEVDPHLLFTVMFLSPWEGTIPVFPTLAST